MFRSARDRNLPLTKQESCAEKKKLETEVYGCDLCDKGGWTSETEVELHKTKMHFKRSFLHSLRKRDDYCCICIKQFPNKATVIKHIKTDHLLSTETCTRVEREIFVCETCTAIFFNKQNLVIHLRYAHLNKTTIKLIKCVLCLRRIQTRNIPAHFYMHNIQSVSTCRICLNKCANTRALNEHLKTHPYHLKCEICLFETNRLDSFQNHVLLSHKNSVEARPRVTSESATAGALTADKTSMTVDDDVTPASENLEAGDDIATDADLIIVICESDPLRDTLLKGDVNRVSHEVKGESIDHTNSLIKHANNESIINNVINEEIIADSDSLTDEDVKRELITKRDMAAVSNSVEDFKKYFIPKTPAYLRLQRVAGVRGIRLSNNVHVCILCREICIGVEEMKLHIEEHKIKIVKKGNTYKCSCGEGFTSKVLLKYHAFKNKHETDVK